jgi:MFS family permease
MVLDSTAGSAVLASRRWRRLVPLVFVTYSLAYLDRSNYSLGVAGGLKDDLGLSPGWSSLLGALFFLGYFLFQIPAAHYAETRSVSRLIFWTVLLWGLFAAAQGVITQLWLLMVDRFLLGVVEAAVLPAMLIFLTHWFSRSERGRANTFLILGNPVTVMWLSAVSGYLIAATSWRWMFLFEGLPAIIWAFVFWLPSILKTARDNGIRLIGLLSAAPYALAAVAMLVASRYSHRSGNRPDFGWPFLLAGAALFTTSVLLGIGHYWVSYALLFLTAGCIYAPYGPYFALIPESLPQSVSGSAMALVNSAGAVGGFVGAYVVGRLQGSFGNGAAYAFMAVALFTSAVLMLGVRTRGRRGVDVGPSRRRERTA